MSTTDKPKTFSDQQATSRTPRGSTLGHSERLTPSEIESLRQNKREISAYMRKRLQSQTKPQ